MAQAKRPPLRVALIHWPVYDKAGSIVVTNVTNFDVHDIARASRTFGVNRYYIVNRLKEQLSFCSRILEHWRLGEGAQYNPTRAEALSIVDLKETLEDCIADCEKDFGVKPIVVTTSGRDLGIPRLNFAQLREKAWDPAGKPILLVFGTGYGLERELFKRSDFVLEPVKGASEDGFNYLSVRSAVSIILDRLLGA